MFYILVFIGILLIGVGISIDKGSKSISQEQLIHLEHRIGKLEKSLFDKIFEMGKVEEEKEETPIIQILDDSNPGIDGLEKYKLLCQYEKENYTIEEISALLNMNKGEVSLLKNLYKNY